MYMFNVSLQPDGILPVDKWIKCNAKTELEALQCACDTLQLNQLPITIHIADDKFLYKNGTPFKTKGFDIDIDKEVKN